MSCIRLGNRNHVILFLGSHPRVRDLQIDVSFFCLQVGMFLSGEIELGQLVGAHAELPAVEHTRLARLNEARIKITH